MALTKGEINKRWRHNRPESWNANKKAYYKRMAEFATNNYDRFTKEDKEKIIAHSIPDRDLAVEIGRSVQAIQVQRSRMKAKEKIK